MSLRSALMPETRILLATVERDQGDDTHTLSRLVERGPEWARLLELAIQERSFPPFWRRLGPLVEDRSLDGTAAVFDRLAANWELYLTLLRRRLVETLDILEDADLEVLLVKGAALALHGYDRFTERPMVDLDLLVAEDQADRVWETTREAGWRWDPVRFPASVYRGQHHHLPPLVDERGSGARLEVHTGVVVGGHDFRFGPGNLWRDALEVRVGDRTARVPRSVPHLVHLCVHFAWSDRLSRRAWKTFRDVDVLVGAEDFDWEAFARSARTAGAERCCYWTLWLARELAGITIPEEVLIDLRPGLPVWVLDRLARHYALGLFATEPGCPSVRLTGLLWRLGVHPGADRREPWPREAEAAPPTGADDRTDGWAWKLGHHLHGRERWGRYLRSVLTGLR